MIEAEETVYSTHMHVVFRYPDKQCKEIDLPGDNEAILRGRAEKIMYNEARIYILIKMGSWLRQRKYWFNKIQWASSAKVCAQIEVIMSFYETRGFFQLCDRLADNRAAIEKLAPAEPDSHYLKTILPILEYCTNMKEGLI